MKVEVLPQNAVMRPFFVSALIVIFAAALHGVAAHAGSVASCTDCGTVQSIQPLTTPAKGSGGGAVVGAVVGAVIGHQFGGSDRSRDAATVGGAVAGGVAGNEIEKRNKGPQTVYKVTVAMDAGGTRQVNVGELNGLAAGQKVKVSGENLERL